MGESYPHEVCFSSPAIVRPIEPITARWNARQPVQIAAGIQLGNGSIVAVPSWECESALSLLVDGGDFVEPAWGL
jgi:hypothetical protein